MTTRNGAGRGRRLATRSRSGSTSVESSSRASLDMQCAAASALGTPLRRNEGANGSAKQYDSDEFSRGTSHVDRRKSREESEVSVRPGKKLDKKRIKQIVFFCICSPQTPCMRACG